MDGEALGLRRDDIDLAGRTLTVRRQVVQESGRKKRKQAAAPCPYRETGHRPARAARLFAAMVDEVGLRRARLHDLRHGYASLLLAGGVQLEAMSKMLGHSGIQITSKVYAHLLPPRPEDSVRATYGRV
ncbi:site-specific integrase [Streptomyces sp. NPDC052051]|uniref:site-specific integrase n=1 Tax=Streptomyces sp. NPDC052051 TaxID=3154649 RepID=UPI0034400A64